MEKILKLCYDKPAPDTVEGWEQWSLPLGCGYLGANVFGDPFRERVQVTENSLANPYPEGLNNLCELYLDFGHQEYSDYIRELNLSEALARVEYIHQGITFSRFFFCSYPDKVLVIRLEASKEASVSFRLRPEIPYRKPYGSTPGDGKGKSGTIHCSRDTVVIRGHLEFYNITYEGQFKVTTCGGTILQEGECLRIEKADSATILVAVGTNYQLDTSVFMEPDPQKKLLPFTDPHGKVTEILHCAAGKSYHSLVRDHIVDYRNLYDRVTLDLHSNASEPTTDKLLESHRRGNFEPYLEELYFQFGRYLLISSSRKGALPPNLQGVWNVHDKSPWSCGYWHNINVQMNYWPVFSTNLSELFEPYADYYQAYLPAAQEHASSYIRARNPSAYEEGMGANGWAIGTGAWPCKIEGPLSCVHSGPGTGGLTAKLFSEWFYYTLDTDVLKKQIWPCLSGMAQFLGKTLKRVDDYLFVSPSASPEQMVCVNGRQEHYHTVGCAFDQQMVFETFHDLCRISDYLDDAHNTEVRKAKEALTKLDPVQVGSSGQIKEFREEMEYGDIGEYHHRHISQLVALYPGCLINGTTKSWLMAARFTLEKRGDKSTGWAMAHRLNAWARLKDGDRSYKLLRTLLAEGTNPNLWDTHPPFQLDGNLGGVAGIAEMLIQSHEGYIELLPALPKAWGQGSCRGLVARGNFVVSIYWRASKVYEAHIVARAGGCCRINYNFGQNPVIVHNKRRGAPYEIEDDNVLVIHTKVGDTIDIYAQ